MCRCCTGPARSAAPRGRSKPGKARASSQGAEATVVDSRRAPLRSVAEREEEYDDVKNEHSRPRTDAGTVSEQTGRSDIVGLEYWASG